jgi:hypothetical protein
MPVAVFQVPLSVQPKGGGEAELVPPPIVQGLNFHFLLVKDGGGEGIIQVEGAEAQLKPVERDKACRKLSAKQLETLRASYPAPKLKQKFRLHPQAAEGNPAEAGVGMVAVDEAGERIVETLQTVRAGFYLIDVPIAMPPHRS